MSRPLRDTGIDRIADALRFIPAEDREIWVKVGMAIRAELGDSGYALWDYWSQSATSYQERAAQLVWRSFKSGGTKIGTLFHLAKEHGYTTDCKPRERVIPVKKAPPPPKCNTGVYAAEIWLRADTHDDAVAGHPYAIAKGISHAGGAGRATASGRVIGRGADCIVVPIRNIETGKVVAAQCINPAGEKQSFGPVSGNGLVLGNTLDTSLYWCVCEGWATGVSLVFHHLHGNAVAAVSFGKSNLDTIAQKVAEIYRPGKIRVLGECDD